MTLLRLTPYTLLLRLLPLHNAVATPDQKAEFALWEDDWRQRYAEAMNLRNVAVGAANASGRLSISEPLRRQAIARAVDSEAAVKALDKEHMETVNGAFWEGVIGPEYFSKTEGAVV